MGRRQSGDAFVTVLVYAAIAAALVGAVYAAYHWVNTTWQTEAGIKEGRRLEHAEMQPKLDTCTKSLADADMKLATQSASIAAAASAAAAGVANGKRLADAARDGNTETYMEVRRLRAELAQGGKGGECPAGAALAKVREGLSK